MTLHHVLLIWHRCSGEAWRKQGISSCQALSILYSSCLPSFVAEDQKKVCKKADCNRVIIGHDIQIISSVPRRLQWNIFFRFWDFFFLLSMTTGWGGVGGRLLATTVLSYTTISYSWPSVYILKCLCIFSCGVLSDTATAQKIEDTDNWRTMCKLWRCACVCGSLRLTWNIYWPVFFPTCLLQFYFLFRHES